MRRWTGTRCGRLTASLYFFASDRGGSMNLWRVPIDEGVRAAARAAGAPHRALPVRRSHQLSADGSRIAYCSNEFEQNVQRLTVDPASEKVLPEPQWVTSGSQGWGGVDVAPDGQSIVLYSIRSQEDIFVARADGTGLRQLTNDAANDRFPKWSPDGRRIAFYSNRAGGWEALDDQRGWQRPVAADQAERRSLPAMVA